jgi:hypothetical protein
LKNITNLQCAGSRKHGIIFRSENAVRSRFSDLSAGQTFAGSKT